MDLPTYSFLAQKTDKYYPEIKDRLINAAMGLSGEAGEVVEHIKKVYYQDQPFNREKVVEELGDVLWYVDKMRREVGASWEEIMDGNIGKLSRRYEKGRYEAVERE